LAWHKAWIDKRCLVLLGGLEHAAKVAAQSSEFVVFSNLHRCSVAVARVAVDVVFHAHKVASACDQIRNQSTVLLWEIP
jgi:hypothetical protein